MDVAITQFRRDLFRLVERAMSGVDVHVLHKGRRLTLKPDGPLDKLSRITPWTELAIWTTGPIKRPCASNGKRTGLTFDRLP